MSLELYAAESDDNLTISRDFANVHEHGKKADYKKCPTKHHGPASLQCNTLADAALT
ncbi:hypothetical protein B0A55_07552, partial [Friedmanniomyces simplex]